MTPWYHLVLQNTDPNFPNFSKIVNGEVPGTSHAHFAGSAGEALAVTQHSYLFPFPTDEKFWVIMNLSCRTHHREEHCNHSKQLEQTCKVTAPYMSKKLEYVGPVTPKTKHMARINSLQKDYTYFWPLGKQLIAFWSKWYSSYWSELISLFHSSLHLPP